MTEEPILTFAKCLSCGRKWTALMPNGCEDEDAKLQCPGCLRFQGVSIDAPIYELGPHRQTGKWFRETLWMLFWILAFIVGMAIFSKVFFYDRYDNQTTTEADHVGE